MMVDPHPLLDAGLLRTEFSKALKAFGPDERVLGLLTVGAVAPVTADDAVRGHVRDLLRHGGYKPTGRGKPASEYLVRAVTEGALSAINLAVDVCNAVSLHSGLPISVVDLSRAKAPFRIGVAPAGSSYVFNASGHRIDLAGLLCLFDAEGPCANAVKDSQRTKTTPETTQTLSIIWGTTALPGKTAATLAWYRELLERTGATVTEGDKSS